MITMQVPVSWIIIHLLLRQWTLGSFYTSAGFDRLLIAEFRKTPKACQVPLTASGALEEHALV